MHDPYYTGRIHTLVNHVKTGYNTKRIVKLGSEKNPLTLVVTSEDRKQEVATLVADNQLFADISVNNKVEESINELSVILNKPSTTRFDKTLSRDVTCLCASSKKEKKYYG